MQVPSVGRAFQGLAGLLLACLVTAALPGQVQKSNVQLTSAMVLPGARGTVTVMLANWDNLAFSQLKQRIELPGDKVTYVSARSGIAAEVSKAEVEVEKEEKPGGIVLLHLSVTSSDDLRDGPLAEVTFNVGQIEPQVIQISHQLQAFDASGAEVEGLEFSDWELTVVSELPEAPPVIFGCFFYMH